jgi:RNA polymerase sigma-70 factor (ECF subfamily)
MEVVVAGVEQLFEREYAPLVRALAVAFGAEPAADAVQDAFIQADRRWDNVRRLDNPAGWVRRVALNRLLNARRDVARRSEILAGMRPVDPRDLTADLIDLRRAVDELPERMRASVCLFYLADLPVEEIAGALGVSVGTVKSNLHDARARLRRTMQEEHHG